MSEYRKVKIGDFLTESKEESFDSDASKRITVRLNCKGIEQRSLKAEKEGATKYFVRHSGQFIYGKQNFHKGAFGIIPEKLDGFTSSADLPAFDFTDTSCCPEYLNLWFQVDERYKRLQKNVKGVGSQRLAVSIFLNQEILLPDLETQKEIVKKVSTNLKNVEILTKEIESQKAYAKQLRQNILQDAIEGKLTAEWRKTHPVIKGNPDFDAEALFEEIAAGKASSPSFAKSKTSKPLPTITDDEKTFEIPEGWKWVRLGEIVDSVVYGTSEKCSYDENQNSKILRIPNISSGYVNDEDLKYTYLSDDEKKELSLKENDLLVIRSNGSPEIVGKMVYVPKQFENYCYAGYLIRLRFSISQVGYFIGTISSASSLRNQIEEPLRSTVGINNINSDEIKALIFPLAPLSEQIEIIKQIENFLMKIDQLEQQITQREEYANQLMQIILKDAFEER